jgi:hypothetical protein
MFLLMATATAAEPPALKACAVHYGAVAAHVFRSVRSALERQFPAGTREYLGRPVAFFIMSAPRHSTLSVSGDARFRCTEAGVEVVYERGTQRVVYPRGSTIVRETVSPRYFVKPGEAMPREVRDGLRAGTIRLNKTL